MRIKAEDDAKELVNNEAIKKIAYISGYANIPIEVLKQTPMAKIHKLFKYLEFTNDPLPEKPITEFTFKGEHYTVMESLRKGQFQDFISCQTALEQHQDNLHKALPIIFAVLAKKEGESLDDYDLIKRAKLFEELPMTIVEPLRVFFYSIGKTSQLTSLLSSMEGKQLLINAKVSVLKNTLRQQVGMVWWQNWLRLMLLRLVMFYEKNVNKFFISIQSKSSKKN
jgi:hypothetical protein